MGRMEKGACVFCKIAAGKLPAKIEYEDNLLLAIWDVKPQADVHLLLMPRKHVGSLLEVMETDNYWTGGIQNLAKQLAVKLGVEGAYKLMLNGGKFADIPHIHYHLLGWKSRKGGVK